MNSRLENSMLDYITPEEEWPDGFQMLLALARQMGTEWLRDAVEQIEEELLSETTGP